MESFLTCWPWLAVGLAAGAAIGGGIATRLFSRDRAALLKSQSALRNKLQRGNDELRGRIAQQLGAERESALPDDWPEQLAARAKAEAEAERLSQDLPPAPLRAAAQYLEACDAPRMATGPTGERDMLRRHERLVRCLAEICREPERLKGVLREGEFNSLYQIAGRLSVFFPRQQETYAYCAAAAIVAAELAKNNVRIDAPVPMTPASRSRVRLGVASFDHLADAPAVRQAIARYGKRFGEAVPHDDCIVLDCVEVGWSDREEIHPPGTLIWDPSWSMHEDV